MQGAFIKKAPLQRALFGWFLYKELLRLAGPHFAKGSLLRLERGSMENDGTANAGTGNCRYWKMTVLENDGTGKCRYWKMPVLENDGTGK